MINDLKTKIEKNITDPLTKKVKMIKDSISKTDNNIADDYLPSFEEATNDESAEMEEPEILPLEGPECVADDTSKGEMSAKTGKKKRSKKSGDKGYKNVKRACDEPAECEVCARKFTTLRSMQRHHKISKQLVQKIPKRYSRR